MLLECKENKTGYLIPISFDKLPFEPKRAFFVTNKNEGDIRGNHAHINEEHFLVCLSGSVKIKKQNKNGIEDMVVKKTETLYQKQLEWLKIEFLEKNTTLLVFSNSEYTEENYIRDYDKFIEIIKL